MPKTIALRIPPGISRPGTKYDSKGRWYDASLVRWNERAMGPVGGWVPAERADDVAVSAAISDDGSSMTDETTDANSAGANDVVLIPATPVLNDAFYIGYSFRFQEVLVNTGTAASDGAVTWEYYNGTAWTALSGVVDNTVGFTVTTSKTVRFTLPWDWAANTVNSQGPFFYIRARVTTAGSDTATGTQVWIGEGPVDVDEVIRGMIAWRSNEVNPIANLAFGTPTKLYVYRQGVISDITAAAITTGTAHAVTSTGDYGDGAYGSGAYGVGNPAIAVIVEAQTWQHDTFGEDLISLAYSDGRLTNWDTSVGVGTPSALISNAPNGCRGVVITPERFVVALGARGNLPTGAEGDRREVIWSDQEDKDTWEPAAANQAGSFVLPGAGFLQAGRRSRAETLLWTSVDLFSMRYIGGVLVYAFQQVGSQCGAISRASMVMVGPNAFWMSHNKFYMYDGFVQEVPSKVSDFVFDNLNRTQASKVFGRSLAERDSIRWYYPSTSSMENDRYVEYNHVERHWTIGALQRTAGIDRDAFDYPMEADANGVVYDHEKGTTYLDQDGAALTPYAESGPFEISDGGNLVEVVGIIPDEKTLGDVQLKIYSSLYPTATETLHGPFTIRAPTDARLSGRQVRLRVEQVNPDWRFGTPRLQVEQGGRR